MDDPMKYWNRFRTPPKWALKPIQAGRLKGKSDISPQWRMQAMTEVFGACGEGWKYEISRLWTEPGPDGQVFAFAQVAVEYMIADEWSEPVPGIGGNMLVQKESKGLYANDEGYKMAITDALSTALKAIGVGADIYQGNMSGSKYTATAEPPKDFYEVFKAEKGPQLESYLGYLAGKGMPLEKVKEKAMANPDGFRAALKAHWDFKAESKGDDKPEPEKAPSKGDKAQDGPRLGDDPAALRRFHAMITQKGYDPELIKTAMRLHQVHPIGKKARYPFNHGTSKDILVSDLPAFKSWLDGLGQHHELYKALGMAPEDMEFNPYALPHAVATRKLKEIREDEKAAQKKED